MTSAVAASAIATDDRGSQALPGGYAVTVRRAFPGSPEQITRVREFVRLALGPVPVLDEAVLLVSELTTNADAPRGALLYPRCSREELKGGSWA